MLTMLLNDAGEPLGHVLYAGDPEVGDCVIRSIPSSSGDFNSPISAHLFALQNTGEFVWRRNGQTLEIRDAAGHSVATVGDGWIVTGRFRIRADHQG